MNVYIAEIDINFYLYGGPGHTESFMDLLDPTFLQSNREWTYTHHLIVHHRILFAALSDIDVHRTA